MSSSRPLTLCFATVLGFASSVCAPGTHGNVQTTAQCPQPVPTHSASDSGLSVDARSEADKALDATPNPDGGEAMVLVDRHGNKVPQKCDGALRILEHLADTLGGTSQTDRRKAVRSDYFDPAGVVLRDANTKAGAPLSISRDEVSRQLTTRSGPLFKKLKHLAELYSRNVGRLSCEQAGPIGVIARLHQLYSVKFTKTRELWRVSEVEYVMIEGD